MWHLLERMREWWQASGDEPCEADSRTLAPADWDDERWDEVLTQWADKITERNLDTAALVVGEAQKPLSFFFGQSVYFMEPFLDSASHFHPLLRGEQTEVLAALLSDRRRLEQLLCKLERRGGKNEDRKGRNRGPA